jgi:hypothetical protein
MILHARRFSSNRNRAVSEAMGEMVRFQCTPLAACATGRTFIVDAASVPKRTAAA